MSSVGSGIAKVFQAEPFVSVVNAALSELPVGVTKSETGTDHQRKQKFLYLVSC